MQCCRCLVQEGVSDGRRCMPNSGVLETGFDCDCWGVDRQECDEPLRPVSIRGVKPIGSNVICRISKAGCVDQARNAISMSSCMTRTDIYRIQQHIQVALEMASWLSVADPNLRGRGSLVFLHRWMSHKADVDYPRSTVLPFTMLVIHSINLFSIHAFLVLFTG
ncbi:hypothetical protein BD289DRAFT_438783 [Coniella lustricola]|uniref:Uncharacterized protein n=1 Tax=Coniella lustricola TaxID=2025994 RepID=A0A2T3A2G6_9PEZI|nr:hypothetical protein BD289DRAFT_438783 [Coniella lustricola]